MDSTSASTRIGILGHVGTENLGDEAILAVLIENIRARVSDVEVIGFTSYPEDTEHRHGIRAFPISRLTHRRLTSSTAPASPQASSHRGAGQLLKDAVRTVPPVFQFLKAIQHGLMRISNFPAEIRFIAQSYRRLKGISLLIIAGSQQLNDFVSGPFGFPYTLFKWAVLARLAGAKVVFASVGAGPFQTRLGRFFLRRALLLAAYRSFRDETSLKWIEQLRLPGKHLLVPDLVFGLPLPEPDEPKVSTHGPGEPPVVGINPVPYCDPRFWYVQDAAIYREFVRHLAEFALWLIGRGYSVALLPTQLRADPPVMRDIRAEMKKAHGADPGPRLLDLPVRSFEELASAIRRTDLFVAVRYHGVLFALRFGRPVLALAYHPKTMDLMRRVGQADCVVDVEGINLAALQEKFLYLEANRKKIPPEISRGERQCQQALCQQYDQIIGLVTHGVAQGTEMISPAFLPEENRPVVARELSRNGGRR